MRKLIVLVLGAHLVAACSRRHDENESCNEHDDCRSELVCQAGRCAVSPQRYQQMARQSGVKLESERPTSGAGPGAVRVRSSVGDDLAFAICGNNERLVGGWCDPPGFGSDNTSFTESGATGYTADDTIGAQWRCQYSGRRLRAFALCQRLADSSSAPADPSRIPEPALTPDEATGSSTPPPP